jgi:hypothetical protein
MPDAVHTLLSQQSALEVHARPPQGTVVSWPWSVDDEVSSAATVSGEASSEGESLAGSEPLPHAASVRRRGVMTRKRAGAEGMTDPSAKARDPSSAGNECNPPADISCHVLTTGGSAMSAESLT